MKKNLVILIILACIPLLSLLNSGLPVTHDGQDHVARIANFYASLQEGNVIPRWASNLNWGFGHPILMFLYPLPSYSASLFHAVGLSFVDSTKVVFGLAFVISVLAMYFWLNDEWGESPAFIGALLYGFAPYRFVDLYVRGAIGEHVAFIFLPLILWAMYGLSQTNRSPYRWGLMLSLSSAGLLLSHNAISLMMLPIAALYGLYLVLLVSEKRLHFLLLIFFYTFLGFILSAFFWVPAFFEGKYTLRDIVTKGEVVNRMVPFSMFLYSPWNYGQGDEFTKSIGFLQWFFVISGLFLIFRIEKKLRRIMLIGSILLFFGILLFMTSLSTFVWSHVLLLQNFQFPWRLLTLDVFIPAVIAAVVVSFFSKSWKKYTCIVTVAIVLGSTFSMWRPKAYKVFNETFFTGIYKGTTDTGESSPIWSIRFMEYQPEVPLEIATGSAIITATKRNTTIRDYSVDVKQRTRFVENTLYFPGWVVKIDGKQVPIEFQDPAWRGRITFWVETGTHNIEVRFTNTKLRNIADIASLSGLIVIVAIATISSKKKTI